MFAHSDRVATKIAILNLLVAVDLHVATSTIHLKETLKAAAANHSPRLFSLLSEVNARWGLNLELEAPKEATIAGVAEALPAADAHRGRELFFSKNSTNCSGCHRVSGQGESLAPDLSSVGLRNDAAKVTESILKPSATIY